MRVESSGFQMNEATRERVKFSPPSEKGTLENVARTLTCKSMPESDLDCLTCS